jgi:Na+/H+ antiporter NhaD/arsenite permease-like protein
MQGMFETMNGFLLLAEVHHVPAGVTIVFALLLVGLILCLALEEKLHAKKSVIAGSFAIVCLLLGAFWQILPFEQIVVGSHELVEHTEVDGEYIEESNGDREEVHVQAMDESSPTAETDAAPLHVDGHRISMPVYIPAIDWGVIAIIFGSSLFVDITSKSGLFTWIAIKLTKFSGGDPRRLLVLYGLMTVLFSAVLNNVTAMIIVGSLTAVSLDRLGRMDKLLGFLLIEGLLTNVGGLLTLISSVPNIIVGTTADISFVRFVYCSAPYVVVATLVTLWMGAKWFGINRLTTPAEREQAAAQVASFDENDGIESWGIFWFGASMLVLFIVTIATTSVMPVIGDLQMGFVALAFAGVMLLQYRSEADQFYRSLDWDLLGFFMGLFVVINVMEHAQVLEWIGKGLEPVIASGDVAGSAAILLASAVFSSVTDNIPLAAMLAKILQGLGTANDSSLWWSVIFGANLGGNITPIGSASTLVAVTIIHRHKLTLSFAGFVKLALPFAVVQLLLATIYVLLALR